MDILNGTAPERREILEIMQNNSKNLIQYSLEKSPVAAKTKRYKSIHCFFNRVHKYEQMKKNKKTPWDI